MQSLVITDEIAIARSRAGSVQAWPVWRISGPCTKISLENLTTKATLMLDLSLTADQIVEIDTRPGHKTVKTAPGQNAYAQLDEHSALWALAPGLNEIEMRLEGASAQTSVACVYETARHYSMEQGGVLVCRCDQCGSQHTAGSLSW